MSDPLKFLKRVAIYTGVIALGGAIYITWKLQSNFSKEEYYRKSMELLDGYPYGSQIFGRPYYSRRLDLGDRTKNWSTGIEAKLSIPITGPREKGTLHTWSSREKAGAEWRVDKLDLEVKEKQWTIFVHPESKQAYEGSIVTAPSVEVEQTTAGKLSKTGTKCINSDDK